MPINIDHSGNVINTSDGLLDFDTTGAIKVPAGTTAQQPVGRPGDIRYNTTTGQFEGFNGAWSSLAGGNGSPGGLDTQLQFNNAGSFAGDADLIWDGTSLNVGQPSNTTRGVVRTLGGIYDYASTGNGGYGGFQSALSTGGASFRAYSGDPNIDTFVDFDSQEITSADLDVRFGRNTNTTGEMNFLIFAGDGTSVANYSMSKTSARFTNRLALGGQFSPQVILDIDATDAIQLPTGTTVERPAPAVGMIRYNTTLSTFEGYTNSWNDLLDTLTGSEIVDLIDVELGNTDWQTGASIATGGGNDQIFWENEITVTTDYTITDNRNAISAGPITINTGVIVTVGTGETWTIV